MYSCVYVTILYITLRTLKHIFDKTISFFINRLLKFIKTDFHIQKMMHVGANITDYSDNYFYMQVANRNP